MTASKTKVKKSNGTKRKASKVATIAKLLTRAKGCTRADVLKATKWPSVSMQQQARAAGIKLRIDDSKTPYVYRAGSSQ